MFHSQGSRLEATATESMSTRVLLMSPVPLVIGQRLRGSVGQHMTGRLALTASLLRAVEEVKDRGDRSGIPTPGCGTGDTQGHPDVLPVLAQDRPQEQDAALGSAAHRSHRTLDVSDDA